MSSQSGSTSSHRNQHCIDIVGFLRKREREREIQREREKERERESSRKYMWIDVREDILEER